MAAPGGGVRIAVWSGPRNVSTALLRSWGSRPDTVVCDEPFYAHYLLRTGAPHPGAQEVIARHETDWRKVAGWLTGPIPDGKAIFYQKHMAHHLLPGMGGDWLDTLVHGFLIREPGEVLNSLIKVLPDPALADTGLPQQVELFEAVRTKTGAVPPVLDARDVLEDPRGSLQRLCRAVGVDFSDAMLSWPAGPRPTDGVWAKHWYAEVEQSTSFQLYRPRPQAVPPGLAGLLGRCRELYQTLYRHRLRPRPTEASDRAADL
jgi:hypothetical protein